tara:strand:+ start:2259 stop:2774 length:516 start_codon:yes stop_codon:yes gene_type:complete
MPKEKVTLYLEPEMKAWLESQVDEEQKVSTVVRNLIRKAMKLKSRKKQITTVNDPFSFYTITADLIPDDLKDYSDLLIEWWPIRKKKGGVCSTKVANRLFDTLRSFPSQDRKEALEKAITGGWKDLFPLKKGYKPEEPKNHPNQKVFRASDSDLPPTLKELGLGKAMNGEK